MKEKKKSGKWLEIWLSVDLRPDMLQEIVGIL